jgi:CRISPR type III-A-associated RAMP protein Csm4
MQPGLLIRLRPLGAWRFGPSDGGHDRVDTLYRSDRLYSAVTLAMQRLDLLDEWLSATAGAAAPAIVFSSLFPFQGDTLYAIPPATLWPPPPVLLHSPSPVFLTKIRWKTARFVPLSVIDSLVTGRPILADQWLPDPESGCLLRRDRPSSSPFRVVVRSTAAVDRLTHASDETKPLACVEFEPSAGLWTVARFADAVQEQIWSSRLQAALQLLRDSGFGGGRGKGWGQTQAAEFQAGAWPALLLPKLGRLLRNAPPSASDAGGLFWLLSLYSPAPGDKVDWAGGNYSLSARGGRIESRAASGGMKKTVRMVDEGCVLASPEEPVGVAVDVAPDGFAHPVYRSGLALALRLPVVEVQTHPEMAAEEASTADAGIEDLVEPEPLLPVEAIEEEHIEAAFGDREPPNAEVITAVPELAAEPAGESVTETPKPPPADVAASGEQIEQTEPVESAEPIEHTEPLEHSEPVERTEPVANDEPVKEEEPPFHEI